MTAVRNQRSGPAFEVRDSGDWICLNCNIEFSKSDSLGRHLYTCLKLCSTKPVPVPVPIIAPQPVVPPASRPKPSKTTDLNTCKICFKVFKNPQYLPLHARVHTGVKPFQCHRCKETFSYRPSLDYHVQRGCAPKKRVRKSAAAILARPQPSQLSSTKSSKKTPLPTHSCKLCPKVFKHKYLLLRHHSQIHSKKPIPKITSFQCTICSKTFGDKWKLIRHWKIHKSLSCPLCSKSFRDGWSLRRHLTTHSLLKMFKCAPCGLRYHSDAALKRHERTIHAEHKADVVKAPVDRKGQANHVARKGQVNRVAHNVSVPPIEPRAAQQQLSCPICETTAYKTSSSLNEHVKRHSCGIPINSTAIKCTRCVHSPIFKYKSELMDHMRVTHGAATDGNATNNEVAVARTHTRKKVATPCAATRNQDMQSVCSLKCSYCPKEFSSSSKLYRHVRGTHRAKKVVKNKKPGNREANVIQKAKASNSKNLKYHSAKSLQRAKSKSHSARGHSPCECQVCHKKFESRWILQKHRRVHREFKPFKCKRCTSRFWDLRQLTRHQVVHSNKYEYECELCTAKYKSNCSLRRHMKQLH